MIPPGKDVAWHGNGPRLCRDKRRNSTERFEGRRARWNYSTPRWKELRSCGCSCEGGIGDLPWRLQG